MKPPFIKWLNSRVFKYFGFRILVVSTERTQRERMNAMRASQNHRWLSLKMVPEGYTMRDDSFDTMWYIFTKITKDQDATN